MPETTTEKTTFTLGTMEDLGVLGLELIAATAVMTAIAKSVSKRCSTCGRSMVAVITTSTEPGTRRELKPENRAKANYSLCDACWKSTQSPVTKVIPDITTALETRIRLWFISGDTGMSSETLVSHLDEHATHPVDRIRQSHPYDADDFGRCVRALERLPELRQRLPLARKISPTWSALVDAWDELEALYAQADETARRSCTDRIRAILEGARTT